MRKKINVAIAGVGNCASAFIQGIRYYGSSFSSSNNDVIGLTSFNLAGYEPSDINFVAAFDIADTKVGKDLSESVFASPNNTIRVTNVPPFEVKVNKGNVLDGFGRRYLEKVKISDVP
jgi:myo-inositol-1-phosphate synthase